MVGKNKDSDGHSELKKPCRCDDLERHVVVDVGFILLQFTSYQSVSLRSILILSSQLFVLRNFVL